MRFRSLHLKAFGPFTDERLDLSGGAPGGLHIVFGPNEAGKSTSLRAVSGLLFGMPHQSRDAHLHASSDLAVAAVIERGTEELAFTRLKRRKDSLVDLDGHPLPDGALDAFLRGLDERSFQSRFGLDQDELESGAEALLGGSEEGLFAAGTAGADARRVLEALQEELNALYRQRGQKPELNRALVLLSEAKKEARIAVRPPEKWREQKKHYDEAVEQAKRLEEKRRVVRGELARLTRLGSVLSDVSRWIDAKRARAELGALPSLPEDADEIRARAQADLRDAELELARLAQEVTDRTERLAALPQSPSLLEVDDERLAALRNQIGSEIKAREDLPKRRGKLEALEDEVRRLLRALGYDGGPEEAEKLRVEAEVERRIRRLAARYGELSANATQTARLSEQSRRELTRAERVASEEPAPVDSRALEDALGRGKDARVQLARLGQLERERCELTERVARLQAVLGIDTDARRLASALPSESEVERGRRERETLGHDLRRVEQTRATAEARLFDIEARIEALRAEGDVPSEEGLASLRLERDAMFSELKGATRGQLVAFEAACERLREKVAETDGVADRLRREAHRVTALATLSRERDDAVRSLGAAHDERAALEMRAEQWSVRWSARWAEVGVSAPEPDDMMERRRRLAELLDVLERKAARDAEHRVVDEELCAAQRDLARALRGDGESVSDEDASSSLLPALGALIDRAERRLAETRRRLDTIRSARAKVAELEDRVTEYEEAARAAAAELEKWSAAWDAAVRSIGIAGDSTPEEAQAKLSDLTELSRALDEAREMRRRVRGMERDSRSFAEQLHGLVQHHAPELFERDHVDAADAFIARVRDARQVDGEAKRLEAELGERKARQATVHARAAAAKARLDELTRAAGVASTTDLPAVEASLRKARALDDQITNLEEALRSKAGAGSLSELIEEAQSIQHDELISRIDELEREQKELDDEVRGASQDVLALEMGLDRYRSEDAALAQQRVETHLSSVKRALQQYLVTRTAKVLLDQEVTRYAERYQGPILSRADEHFQRLTLGKYSGLRVGVGERVLRCVRDGKDIEVHQLSRGTRAQLYLALRIASLEQHFAHHSAVPLVFDDLFVDFDDDRACAAFEILGELSDKVQILYFTHLGRDLHAARDAVKPGRLFEHTIGVEGVSSSGLLHIA